VFIEVPQYATNRDPEIFPNPDEFDPWRFAREREKAREKGLAEEAAQNQFVSVSPHGLTFGYGRHACPGRFFAANEIKMIVAQVVMGWELKMPDGVQGRWEDLCLGAGVSIPEDEGIQMGMILTGVDCARPDKVDFDEEDSGLRMNMKRANYRLIMTCRPEVVNT